VTAWLLRYEGYDAGAEPLREALCTLGNGRFATRGAAPESRAGGCHYPGTYAAGVFNRLGADVDGHHVENESIVNLPDWQSLTMRSDGGDWVDLDTMAVSGYVQELDLRRGVLARRFTVTDGRGLTRKLYHSSFRTQTRGSPDVDACPCVSTCTVAV